MTFLESFLTQCLERSQRPMIDLSDFSFSYSLFRPLFSFAYELKPAHAVMKAAANGSCGKQLVSNVCFL